MATHALERTEQRSFSPQMCRLRCVYLRREIESRTFPEKPWGTRFRERSIHDPIRYRYCRACRCNWSRSQRVGGNQHAFDQHAWVAFHQVAILGCLVLIRRRCKLHTWVSAIFRNETPLHAGGKPAPLSRSADFLLR